MAKVLIIDRLKNVNWYYKEAFEKVDVEVLLLDDFESALYILSIDSFDAVIIDPVYVKSFWSKVHIFEGLELIRKIKEEYSHIPIIVNSAVDTLDDDFKKFCIPIDSYVIKSIDESKLVSEVITHLNLPKTYKASPKKQAKIFLSYAKEDFSKVYAIYEVLKQMEYCPWIDHENIFPGQDWELEIEKAIKNANFFIAFLSKNSVSKEGYFQKEIKKGIDILDQKPEGSIYLIPIRLDNCQVPSRFASVQWCNAFEEHGMKKLIKAIEIGCIERGILDD